MTPYQQFKVNRDSAKTYVRSYEELRRFKNLGVRGALTDDNKYLLWLPRGAIVSAIGALDHYVHQVLYERLPSYLRSTQDELNDATCDLILRVATIKNKEDVRNKISFIRSDAGINALVTALEERVLQYESFQRPDKVVWAFKFLGHDDILHEVADIWQGPNTDRAAIASRLELYVKRRNQIAHEGDLQRIDHLPRPISPLYANTCIKFITVLVTRINDLLYGPIEEDEQDE